MTRPGWWRQGVRFLAVGAVAAVVDFGLLVVLMDAASLGHTPAKALSWAAGTATAYIGNRRFTFQAGPSKRRAAAVALLYGLTFAVQVGLFHVLYPPFERWWGQTGAQVAGFVVAQGVATVTNFAVQRQVIFRSGRD
ncbi:MAG: GtrA family protein [Propionibacteriaceae bacterium]|nr:GtrA family protein [Propionibacteriaceae bacterium]